MGEKKQVLAVVLAPLLTLGCPPSQPSAPLPELSEALLVSMSKDPAVVAEGKQLFLTTCVACHGPQGQGMAGPNLTDGAWLHGSAPLQIHTSVSKGFPDKGMAPFESLLGPARVRSVTGYVLTLKGTNLPGKAPEGTPD